MSDDAWRRDRRDRANDDDFGPPLFGDETPTDRNDALSFGAADPTALDVFAVADALWRRGWYVDRQGPPPSLHLTVNAVHADKVESFLADLRASIDEVTAASASGDQGAYGTID